MSSTLQHRGYEGSVQYGAEDKLLHGRLLCARDVVSFGGTDLVELEKTSAMLSMNTLPFAQKLAEPRTHRYR